MKRLLDILMKPEYSGRGLKEANVPTLMEMVLEGEKLFGDKGYEVKVDKDNLRLKLILDTFDMVEAEEFTRFAEKYPEVVWVCSPSGNKVVVEFGVW